MPTPLLEMPSAPPPLVPARKRWTRAECATLEASGLFEQESVELVQGELLTKMGKKRPHVNTFTLVNAWLIDVFGVTFLNVEAPIDVAPEDNPINEPVPDLIVLAQPSSTFQRNPGPQDRRLVVEIAHSSLTFDLSTKAALYARAGILEYWVADIERRRIIVHRQPDAGRYQSVIAYSDRESVAPLAAPDREFPVASAFPL